MDPTATGPLPPRGEAQMALAGLIQESEGRTRLGDEFRIAASRLREAVDGSIAAKVRGGNLVLVTSTRPAEGKSFSAVNLAAALAETGGCQVILVDADFKPRCLSDLLSLLDAPGLLEFSADPGVRPESLVVGTCVPRLSVIPLGKSRAGRSSPAGERSQSLAAAAQRLSAAFPESIVILDTGPLLSTSDPSVLAPVVGQTVMVIEAAKTQRSEIDAAMDLLRINGKVMVLLNKVAIRTGSSFGAYSYGGYYAHQDAPPPQRPAQ